MNGKTPPAFPTSERFLLNVEPRREARTPHGKRRVLARQGRAGEKSDFFSILLEMIGDADQDMLCSVDPFKASSSNKGIIEP